VGQSLKQEIRQKVLDLIQHQPEADAYRKSRVIASKVLAMPVFQKARTILFYCSFKGEVDTFPLIEKAIALKKRVAVPFIQKEIKQISIMLIESTQDLVAGPYGIPSPRYDAARVLEPSGLDLVFVPGVAFDRANNRLGRGAGYYDRFLSELPAATPTIGLAYDLQLVTALPGLEPHDRPVSLVVTN
jgi:5-formyltetrahydrofolate cyclo-ligase